MTDWIKKQIKSKLFKRLFVTTLGITLIATLLPIIGFVFYAKLSGLVIFINFKMIFFIGLFVILLIITALAGMVAFSVSKNISSPLSEFNDSVTEIARGNFNHQVEVKSDDEIGRLAKLINYMTTELRRLNKMNLAQIIAERTKTQTIIQYIADGVIVTDPKLNVLIMNSTAEKWFALKASDVLEKSLADFVQDDSIIQFIKNATEQETQDIPATEIIVKPEHSWKQRVLQAHAARVLDEDNNLIGIATIFRDITEAKEVDKMKTELVSMVAHELRSPLTSISGFSELIMDPELPPEVLNEYATIILSESNRLGELVNKFLDISKIESGRIQPNKEKVDLSEIIQIVVGNNSYLAQKKNINVKVIGDETEHKVFADYGMMEQVFLNLFSNAVKYSPEKTNVSIVLEETDSKIKVSVKDEGYGIPKESLSKIFDKFYRVSDNNTVHEETGTGLGLALVKELVELHNGSLDVQSTVGEGTTFSIVFDKLSDVVVTNVERDDSDEMIY